jgi:PBP1b-binding outer membrane lipoprotein LpoB
MHKIIAGLILAAALVAGCGGETATESAPLTSAKPKATSVPTTTTKPTATTVSERLAHWQDVVKSMKCPELNDLEQKRLAIQFNDQAESLVAIHDRQAKLHC